MNDEADGKPDGGHVHPEAKEEIVELVGAASVKGGEGEDDETHHEFHGDAEEEAAHDPVV